MFNKDSYIKCKNLPPAIRNSIIGCNYNPSGYEKFNPQTKPRYNTIKPLKSPQPIPALPKPIEPSPFKPHRTGNPQQIPQKPIQPPPRQLRKVSKLTEHNLDKGKFIDAAYELDTWIQQDIDEINAEGGERIEIEKRIMRTQGQDVLRKVGLSDWTLDPNLSTKQYLVVTKDNNTRVVFRGRSGNDDLIPGDEGLPRNVIERLMAGEDRVGVDTRAVMDTLQGRKRDFGYIDELYHDIKTIYPENTLEVVSYSNGTAKALHMTERYNIPHTIMDGVLGPNEVKLLKNRTKTSPPLEIIRPADTAALATGKGLTEFQITTGRQAPHNTEITNIETLELPINPVKAFFDAHAPHHYSGQYSVIAERNTQTGLIQEIDYAMPNNPRPKAGIIGRGIKSAAGGVIPGIIAGVAVEGLVGDQPEQAKIAEEAVLTAGGTQILAPVLGAGSASAATLIAPLYASFQAGNLTAKGVDALLPEDMNKSGKGAIEGGTAGAISGLTFVAADAAQTAAISAASSLFTSGAAAEAGAVGLEMGALAGAETALLSATEATGIAAAGEGFANPFADAAFIMAGTGLAIGAGIGAVAGLFQKEEEKPKTFEEQYNELSDEKKQEIQTYQENAAKLQSLTKGKTVAHGTTLIEKIHNDAKYQSLFQQGNRNAINQRIRQIIIENQNNSHVYMEIIQGFEKLPQINKEGEWENLNWDDHSHIFHKTPPPPVSNIPESKEIKAALA